MWRAWGAERGSSASLSPSVSLWPSFPRWVPVLYETAGQVGMIYLTSIIYLPTSAELDADLEGTAVMCTSLLAEKVVIASSHLALLQFEGPGGCGEAEWLSCTEWCLADPGDNLQGCTRVWAQVRPANSLGVIGHTR